MKFKLVALGFLLPTLLFAQTGSGMTRDQMIALIAQLQEQIRQILISRVATLQTNIQALTQPLYRGVRGEEVVSLQRFLANQPGLYPEAQVTGYFGPATEAAVK